MTNTSRKTSTKTYKDPFVLSIKIPCFVSEKVDTGPKVVAHSNTMTNTWRKAKTKRDKDPFVFSIKITCWVSEQIETGLKVVAHSSNSGIRDPYYYQSVGSGLVGGGCLIGEGLRIVKTSVVMSSLRMEWGVGCYMCLGHQSTSDLQTKLIRAAHLCTPWTILAEKRPTNTRSP